MLKNYLKITARNLTKNKLFSIVNILGLTIGITCFILIGLFVLDELTYDSFNTNSDRIFRLNSHYKIGNNEFNLANSPMPLADALVSEYPEIEKTARLLRENSTYVKKDNDYIKEERFFYADSSLFDIFTINFISGNPRTALTQPKSLIITANTAEKYFSSENPVGKRITLANGMEFLITGVVKPVPENSHFEFDFIASLNSLPGNGKVNWFGQFVHTYVMTNKGVTAKELNKKIYSVAEKHLGPIIKSAFGVSYKEFLNSGNDFSFTFVPLKGIHLYSKVFNELKEAGSINTVYLFSTIAFFILIIASINFINLATARSAKRANEIGVRKVLGSNKMQLVKQFLSESILLCLIAVIISVMLVELLLPYFNGLTDKDLSLNLSGNAFVIPGLILFTLILGTAAGFYPSILLASFKPALVLKSKAAAKSKKGALRKALVIFQFATSVVLFVGTLVIYNQMQYIKNKNLGFNKDQVLVINNINDLGTKQFTFADAVKENVNVMDASLSFGLPGHDLTANIFKKKGENNPYTLVTLPVDYNYLNTYQLKLADGRYFSKNISSDTSAIILNEAAVKKLNFKNPLNSELLTSLENENNAVPLKIIGVVKDFHLQTFKDEIRPAALILLNTPEADFLSVKISSNDMQNTIKYLSAKWKEFGQIKPMEYSFFDDNFNELYKSEIQSEKVFTIFALLAVVIACLGLLGLTAFTAEQRKKEIGIRKVLGATVANIVAMLSKEYLLLIAAANLIAWPVSYYIMNMWLEDFAYKTDISLGVFLVSGLLVLVIALITVSFQAINAAVSNPVNSIRYE